MQKISNYEPLKHLLEISYFLEGTKLLLEV